MAAVVKGTPNAAASTSVTIPTHAPGDLIVISAYRDGSTTTPTKPAAGGTVPTWTDIDNNTGGNTNSMRTAYCIATASNHTSGTWTNATGMTATVITNFRTDSPIGAHSESGSTANGSAVCPAITLQDSGGTSLILNIMGHRTVTAWSAAPAGYTSLANAATETQIGTKNASTSSAQITWNCTSTNSGYRGTQIEIRARVPKNPAPDVSISPGLV